MLLHELERLRRDSGVSAERAAHELGCRVSKISRIHLGQSKVSPGDTKLLAELYGAGPDLTAVLIDLARNLGKKGDWTSYRTVYRESFRLLLDLERHSSRIRVVQSEIVPGLLQTEGYVRALNDAPTPFGRSVPTDDVVHARRERQGILTRRENRPMLSVVFSESSLRREYGDRDIMGQQMQRLLDVARLPNVQLQVLPFRNASPVTYASLNFALLHIPGPGVAAPLDFVYVEQFDDARYLDDHDRVAAYEQLWGHLQAAALGPTESSEFIGEVAGEYR
ncbi:MAG: helix-turn-helix domain-containing protein [Actinomycetota bacterium]|nr:helix-turn-helix domain-containing protein [Actinomycetota bacterium]